MNAWSKRSDLLARMPDLSPAASILCIGQRHREAGAVLAYPVTLLRVIPMDQRSGKLID